MMAGMRALTIAAVLTALLVAAAPAAASSVPSFTATPGVDRTVAFDASSSVCEFGPCGYNWRWDDGSRLGVTMGQGVRLSYRFAQSGPQTVVLTVSGHCNAGSSSFCPRSLSKQVIVPASSAPPSSPPPPAPAPAPPPPPAAPKRKAAARPGQTVTVTVARAKVDREPGRRVIGSIAAGSRLRVDRIHRVTRGRAKGLWYHGTAARAGGSKITGWVRATAFA
jgi:hypothetical protein